MNTMLIRTTYACCTRRCVLIAITAAPQQAYMRRCRPCETVWSIRRVLVRDTNGARIDRLEWTDTATRQFRLTYGDD